MFDSLANYPTLTDAQRIQAREVAHANLIARYARRKPRRSDFDDHTAARYPRAFTLLIGLMLVLVALAAGWISGVRLYFAGKAYALATIHDYVLSVAIGLATVLAAELLVILATVAGQVYLRGRKQVISLIPVIVGMVVAFVGNWTVTQPATAWGLVETLFPPVAVLSVAFFFEITLLPDLERRQANEVAFQQARARYDTIHLAPESHPRWLDMHGKALWETWREAFAARFDMVAIPQEVRRLIAHRELSFDHFFDESLPGTASHDRQDRIDTSHLPDVPPDVKALPGKRRVKAYLTRYPGVMDEDKAVLADKLDVSGRTVYRGFDLVANNGKTGVD